MRVSSEYLKSCVLTFSDKYGWSNFTRFLAYVIPCINEALLCKTLSTLASYPAYAVQCHGAGVALDTSNHKNAHVQF